MAPLAGHAAWNTFHADPVALEMTAWVRITRSDAEPANDGGGWSKDAPVVDPFAPVQGPVHVWEGPARLQAQASAALTVNVAEADVTVRMYLLQLPLADGPRWPVPPPLRAGRGAGDVVEVLDCPGDTQAIGRVLRVVDVQHGSMRLGRDVICSDSLTENNPTAEVST